MNIFPTRKPGSKAPVEVDPAQFISMADLINIEYRAYLTTNKKDRRAYNFGEWLGVTYPNAILYKRTDIEAPKPQQ